MTPPARRWSDLRRLELIALAALIAQHQAALRWVVRTWGDATYESWGFCALLLVVPLARRAPERRVTPSSSHLVGLAALSLLDLALAPLRLHVVGALLGVVSLQLWAVAFRAYRGCWLVQRQLWLGLLSLPVAYWVNILCGTDVQQLVTALAARVVALYGLPVTAQGTVMQLSGAVIAVDASCSGLKLLYIGVLFGVVAAPAAGLARRLAFWGALGLLLLGANVVRVVSLTLAQLHLHRPVGPIAHEAVGLIAFAMACAASLVLARRLARAAASRAAAVSA